MQDWLRGFNMMFEMIENPFLGYCLVFGHNDNLDGIAAPVAGLDIDLEDV